MLARDKQEPSLSSIQFRNWGKISEDIAPKARIRLMEWSGVEWTEQDRTENQRSEYRTNKLRTKIVKSNGPLNSVLDYYQLPPLFFNTLIWITITKNKWENLQKPNQGVSLQNMEITSKMQRLIRIFCIQIQWNSSHRHLLALFASYSNTDPSTWKKLLDEIK